jgi:hypothetical protein
MNFLHYICFSLSWLALIQFESTYIYPVLTYIVLFIITSKQPLQCSKIILTLTGIGLLIDFVFIYFHIIEFANQNSPIPPLWYICLWPLFATAAQSSLRVFINTHILAQILMGAFSSYLAFHFGTQINQNVHVHHFLPIIICWAFIFPLSLKLSKKPT